MVLKQPTYHLSERICPYCDNSRIRFSDKPWLHIVRQLYGSYKRYCPECEAKWRIKVRSSSRAMQEIWVIIIGAVLGFLFFYVFSLIRDNLPSAEEIQGDLMMGAVSQGDQLVQTLGDPQTLSSIGYKSAEEIYKLAPLQHRREAADYVNKFSKADPKQKAKILDKAQTYVSRYQKASDDEKSKLIQEARRKLRSYRG